jgi:quercetin dioxygenase-like cupin family protein
MEFIKKEEIKVLMNPGFESHQLLFPENSKSTRVTITKVSIQSGAINHRHQHEASEQIWIAIKGRGKLLVNDGMMIEFEQGDVARFEDGEQHGFHNDSDEVFEYISVTSPPINFRSAYQGEK